MNAGSENTAPVESPSITSWLTREGVESPKERFKHIGLLSPCAGFRPVPVVVEETIVIGRDPDTDISISHPAVSRRHAQIVKRQGEFVLEDLGSINGTFVDGVPIVSCVLRDGDQIAIGKSRFWFDRMLAPTDVTDPADQCMT